MNPTQGGGPGKLPCVEVGQKHRRHPELATGVQSGVGRLSGGTEPLTRGVRCYLGYRVSKLSWCRRDVLGVREDLHLCGDLKCPR